MRFVSFSNFIKMIAPYALITLFVLYLIALCFNTFTIIAAQMPQKQIPPQNKSLNKTDRIFLISTAIICLSICAFSFWLGFPGYIVDADIFSALNLNKNNWHPVFTAYILQILYAIFGKHTFYLFLINLIPFYVGIFFLIAGFYLHFRSKFALLLIFPTFIGNLYFSNFVCMSYIALGNMCFCAYSMILFLLLYTPRVWIRRVMWSGIFVLLFFALLWRHNAIFSVFPAFLIICYMFLQQAQLDSRIFIRNYIKLVLLSALMCVIIVKSLPAIITKGNSNPASHIFLYQLVGACVRANDSECIPRDWYVKGKNFNDLKQEYYANKTYWYGISSLNTDNPPNLMSQYKKYFFKYFKYFVSHQWQFFKIMARQIPNDDVTGWVQSSVKSYATLSAKPTHEWHKSVAKQFKENERYIHFSESKKEIYDFMFNHKILLSNKWSVAGSFAIMIISCLLRFSVRFRGLLSFNIGNLGSLSHSLLIFSFASSAASFFSFVFICLFIAFSWSRYTAPLLPLAIISLIGFIAFVIESKINKK